MSSATFSRAIARHPEDASVLKRLRQAFASSRKGARRDAKELEALQFDVTKVRDWLKQEQVLPPVSRTSRILALLVEEGALSRRILVRSPFSGAILKEFNRADEVPESLVDPERSEEFQVGLGDIEIVFKLTPDVIHELEE